MSYDLFMSDKIFYNISGFIVETLKFSEGIIFQSYFLKYSYFFCVQIIINKK